MKSKKEYDKFIDIMGLPSISELLKCPICRKPFKKIDEYTYKFDCACPKNKDIRIAVLEKK